MEYSNKIIEDLLQGFKFILNKDYERYKNHVYRVFFNCLLIDGEKTNEEKYAVAALFHDIGIWTNHTFDYLDPSIEQARFYLTETRTQDWVDEITLMIFWHHKAGTYKGDYEKTVETFRKADWIDVSLGFLSFGFNKQKIKEIRKQLPNLGFHIFLIKETIKYFFKQPLNPIPVLKK